MKKKKSKKMSSLFNEKDSLKAVLDSMEDGVYVVDKKHNILYINSALRKIFGDPAGRKCYEYFCNEKKYCSWCRNTDVFEGKSVSTEWFSDKSKRTYEVVNTPLRFPDGETHKMGLLRDITKRKELSEECKKQRGFMHDIFQAIPHPFYVINTKNYNVELANPASKKFGDIEKGTTCYSLTHNRKEPCGGTCVCPIELVKKTKKKTIVEHTHRDKKGNSGSFEVYCYPIMDEKGKVTHMIESAVDITERKEKQQALKEAHEALKIEHKKFLEMEEQLVQATKLTSMGQIAAGVAHELNTPLAGIMLMLKKYYQKKSDWPGEGKDLEIMLNSAGHMAKVISDLMAFAVGKKSEFTKLDINDVIKSTLSFSANLLVCNKIVVKERYAKNLPMIKGDKRRLQQGILNIITNAKDAMPDGGEFTIRTRKNKKGDKVIMDFIDTGIGIAEEDMEKVCDPFFTTKDVGKGVGLGLSVTQKIIKNHKGDIAIKSEIGKGTKFTVSLHVKK